MTRRFVENDTLFFFDRRVVFGVSKCRVFVIIKVFVNVQCDTCDSKKIKLLWYVRLYAWSCVRLRARGGFSPSTIQDCNSLSLLLPLCTRPSCKLSFIFARKTITIFISVFDIWRWRKWGWEDFVVQFFVIFSLFPPLSPHILIEPFFSAVDCFIPRISALYLHLC